MQPIVALPASTSSTFKSAHAVTLILTSPNPFPRVHEQACLSRSPALLLHLLSLRRFSPQTLALHQLQTPSTHNGWSSTAQETQGHRNRLWQLVCLISELISLNCIFLHVTRGSTISKVIGENTKANPKLFEEEVQMWVYE